jgi:hypothetical protein
MFQKKMLNTPSVFEHFSLKKCSNTEGGYFQISTVWSEWFPPS